jgi:mannose-6-phosphate isomerase-like protein (cupin superfamily)
MSDWTQANIRTDVKNAAAQSGMAPEVEARFARGDLDAAQVGVSFQRLEPNARMPFGHHHKQDEEVYVVVAGSGRVKLDDEIVDVSEWDAIRVGPKTTRAFEAGPDGIEFLAFGTHTDDDVEMLPDWWKDD